MKQKFILAVTLTLFMTHSAWNGFSQNIPNAGFENWTNAGNYEDPDEWFTLNVLADYGAPVTVQKSTDAQSGIYAIRLESLSFINNGAQDSISGIAITGYPGNSNPGFSFTSRPDSLIAWYKYIPSGADTGVIAVFLTKWNNLTGIQDSVGMGQLFITSTVSAYTRTSIKIDYYTSAVPDTAMIAISSSYDVPHNGSILYADNLSFAYPLSVKQEENTFNSFLFPNPSRGNDVYLHFENDNNSREQISISLYNALGNEIKRIPSPTDKDVIIIKNGELQPGLYFYRINNNNESIIPKGKIIIE